MDLSTKKILAVVVATAFLLPVVSQAAELTTDQVNSVIALLQSFNVDAKTVQNVQSVLTHTPRAMLPIMGSTTPRGDENRFEEVSDKEKSDWNKTGHCIPPARNLMLGARGEDVKNLQQILAADSQSGFTGTTTGFYGPMTARAMMRFQENHRVASSTTGTVGPATRGFLERFCGKVMNASGTGMATGTPQRTQMMSLGGTPRPEN